MAFAQAREKLSLFHSSDPDRFLLLLVSGGVARGASRVEISRTDLKLSVSFRDVYLDADELTRGADDLLTETSPSQDLTVGLVASLQRSPLGIEVRVQDPERRSYLWTMQDEAESLTSAEPGETGLLIDLRLQKKTPFNRVRSWLRTVGGYGGMPGDCRWVDRMCERSPVPITINGQAVNRPFHPPDSVIAVALGGYATTFSSPFFQGDSELGLWGALALNTGKLEFVLSGVSYAGPEDLLLCGFVGCQGLKRDASREQIVQDADYQSVVQELLRLRREMVKRLLPRLREVRFAWSFLPRLVWEEIRAGELAGEELGLAVEWWSRQVNYKDGVAALSGLPEELSGLGRFLVHKLFERFELRLELVGLGTELAKREGGDNLFQWLCLEAWISLSGEGKHDVRLIRVAHDMRKHFPGRQREQAILWLCVCYHLRAIGKRSGASTHYRRAKRLGQRVGCWNELHPKRVDYPRYALKQHSEQLSAIIGPAEQAMERLTNPTRDYFRDIDQAPKP